MHLLDNGKHLILYFSELQGYEDIELIAEKFQEVFKARILNKLDGPYSRIWDLEIDGEKFQLIADDPYGSSIRTTDESSKNKLKELIPVIETFIN